MKTILVFEDSTRVNCGGGQKMTLIVCNILKERYNLRFVDFTDKSRYAQMVKDQYGNDCFVNIGHGSINGLRELWTWVKMCLVSCLYIITDTRKILKDLSSKDCISYTTNKRGLLIAFFLKLFYGIPYIHHAHLVENPKALYYKLARLMFKSADRVLCVSNTVLKSINTPNCSLVYNPSLNNRGFKGEKVDSKFVVAFVGSLISIKGIEYFIDAAKLCPDSIEFRIYGEGALKEPLQERASGRVKFMGFEKDIISRYYEDVDVLIVPTILQEALSLVAVDAKSVGLPCIVTSPGGQAEIIEHGVNGYHVQMRNAQEMASAVIRLTSDTHLYNNMMRSSYESFGNFSYIHFKEIIASLFNY